MTELELLKEHWSKQDDFQVVSREELHKMIKKSSSNILKWLIAANIFELSFFLLLPFIFSSDANVSIKNPIIIKVTYILDYLLVSLPIIFSIVYLYLISNIHTTDSISLLLKNIFRARKLLNVYIILNVCIFLIILYTGIFEALNSDRIAQPTGVSAFTYNIIVVLSCIFVGVIFMLIIWSFYKLIYGRLLKKLNKNYKELKDLE
ncbi:hypothetical protein H1R17_12465 [Flavobacterium sp. xlx-214]|uniref:hypothetical protein n=1 Tax=unclassified Flavobacterium TaxID=196869 RepID=UPI0013D0AD5B|nr:MULTISPECIES: hypothetical protein [unclassified Flavobacterium]MBA5793722.1 hypothetical protein [Flavobacterium sp. xlx-221]QMI83257.1 hypothetical protein H1R17_12465 [Flavobacterium sp. xlx-214]